MTSKHFNLLKETLLHKSFLKVKRYELRHQLFSGDWSPTLTRELLERPRVAAVLPYDPKLDAVVLIEQFRPGPIGFEQNPWLMEIVAGVAEGDEPLEALAQRELKEEAGLEALSLKLIHHYWVSPAICDERTALFYAEVDASNAGGIHGLAHEHEDIKVHVIPAQTAFEYTANGVINNAIALIALQWLQIHHASLQTM